MDHFLKHWFQGFDHALDLLNEQERITMLRECGKGCCESYPRQIFIDSYAHSCSVDDFFHRLARRFAEMEIITVELNREYQIAYRFCACDLIKNGFIKNPLFCECSRQSMLYNLESSLGKDRANVDMIQTLLGGADCCLFHIKII